MLWRSRDQEIEEMILEYTWIMLGESSVPPSFLVVKVYVGTVRRKDMGGGEGIKVTEDPGVGPVLHAALDLPDLVPAR